MSDSKDKLVGFDMGYTNDGCTLSIEWREKIDIEGATSPADLSNRTVDLIRRILETALAEVVKGIEKKQITLPTFGDPS